LGAQTWFD
jgi:hypothetical protein